MSSLDTYSSSLSNYQSVLDQSSLDEPSKHKYSTLLQDFTVLLSEVGTTLQWEALILDARQTETLSKNEKKWANLTPKECIDVYRGGFPSKNRNLVLILYNQVSENNISLSKGFTVAADANAPQSWIGCGYLWDSCDTNRAMSNVANNKNWTTYSGVVKECRSEITDEHCKLQFSTAILSVVIVCNLVKALSMLLLFLEYNFDPLVTLGDAIQSFIERPDPNTSDMCYAGREDINVLCKSGQSWNSSQLGLRKVRKYRWWNAVGRTRWITCICCMVVTLFATAGLLSVAVLSDARFYGSSFFISNWGRGFGQLTPSSIIKLHRTKRLPFALAVLLANAPQSLLSFLYLMYNAVYSSMLMGKEWDGYAGKPKYLRVSSPQKNQRSTYWLQLPFRYAIPLMVLSGLLHWLTSQSIYLARIEIVQNPPQYPYVKNEVDVISTISFSTIALIFVVLSSIFAIIAVVVTGRRRYKHPNIPVAGSCSAAISAACHPMGTGQRRHLGKLKLSEGFVDGVKYLSFTEEVVATPMNGHVDGEQTV